MRRVLCVGHQVTPRAVVDIAFNMAHHYTVQAVQ